MVRLGGCASSRDGGIPSVEDIQNYNQECKRKSQYAGPDITPTDEECRNPSAEPLSTGEKIVLSLFLVAGAVGVAAAAIAVGAELLPVVIAGVVSAEEAATASAAFYYANAVVVNEIGLFAAGVLISCDGNVAGLLKAVADDPAQALPLFYEIMILHTQISIANGPARRATLPVQLLPPEEQTGPHPKFRSQGPPEFSAEETTGTASTPKATAPPVEDTPGQVPRSAVSPGGEPAATAFPAGGCHRDFASLLYEKRGARDSQRSEPPSAFSFGKHTRRQSDAKMANDDADNPKRPCADRKI